MQLLTVRLDRVFDVVHLVHQGAVTTLFGFQCGQTRVFGARMQGEHVLAAGTVLTACLREANDWATLLGWYNHATGEIVLCSIAAELCSIMGLVLIAAALTHFAGLAAPVAAGVLAVTAACCGGSLRTILLLRRARAALWRVRAAAPAAPVDIHPVPVCGNRLRPYPHNTYR